MDFSLKSIALFLIVIFPGIVFRRFFFQGEFTKQFNSKPWLQSALYSLIPGLLIHTFLLFFINLGYGLKNIDFSPLERFYENLINQSLAINLIDFKFLGLILIYYLIILVLSWLFAIISWNIVRSLKLDSKYKVFRFQNYWNYYFKGEIKNFREFEGIIDGKVLYVKADVMVNTDEDRPRLYNGELRQYTINKDNSLENIYLTNVKYYTGERDEKGKPMTKEIPGDCLILPYKNITNINLNYFANRKKETDYGRIIGFLWILLVVFIIASGSDLLTGSSIIKTILIKLFFIVYTFLLVALIAILIKPKLKYDQKIISEYDHSKDNGNIIKTNNYKLEFAKKKKKKENENALWGLLTIILILSLTIYFKIL